MFCEFSIIAQLKQSWKDEEEAKDNQESKASLEAYVANNDNPYYPYNQELLGYDVVTTLDLAED